MRAHPERVRAGRQAADFGVRGPAALLREEATWKDGRLECEWQFDDDKAFLADFVVEQPMAGDEPVEAEVRSGMAILSGNTSMMLKVVFDPSDVTWEADCVADDHRDYGLIGLQESKDYRAFAMEVWNTQFRLKKGSRREGARRATCCGCSATGSGGTPTRARAGSSGSTWPRRARAGSSRASASACGASSTGARSAARSTARPRAST